MAACKTNEIPQRRFCSQIDNNQGLPDLEDVTTVENYSTVVL